MIGSQHEVARRIYAGQTIAGSFVDGGDPAGNYSDYNDYFFIGTAGSTISVILDRADASLSWEDPASLDPQIEVIAPDGMIYQNLISKDKRPGVDYNASLTNAVLPLTGGGWEAGSGIWRRRDAVMTGMSAGAWGCPERRIPTSPSVSPGASEGLPTVTNASPELKGSKARMHFLIRRAGLEEMA